LEHAILSSVNKETLERAARLYKQNAAASAALGITQRTFSRLCRQYGIETPYARRYGRSDKQDKSR
jgi:hypothetical protein